MPNFIIKVKETGAKKADKNVKGLNRSLGSLKSSAMMAAGAFLGAGALIAGIKGAINAFGEQELAEKKLEASLGHTSQALLDQAAALQQVSNFGDETIISAQALIAAFVDDEEQIKLATQATLDLAAAKGMDLNAAADLVSKTLGSSTNAMSRYGIEVQGAVGSTERLASLTGNIANKFGGQAKAQSETYTGAVKGMNDAIGDAAESIGGLLAPAIMKIAGVIKTFAEGTDAFIEWANGVTNAKEATEAFETQTKTTKSLIQDIEEEFGLTAPKINAVTGETIDLLSQMDFLKSTLMEMSKGDFFQGIASNSKIRTAKELKDEIASYNSTLIDNVEHSAKINETDLRRTDVMAQHLDGLKKVAVVSKTLAHEDRLQKEQALKDDLKHAALSGQSASESMKSVVRAKLMESIASAMASVFKNPAIPFPFNMIAAAGVGTALTGLTDKALAQVPSFAQGGDFVTSGSQMIMVGDNASGKEHVKITPLDNGGDATGGGGAVNITFNSPIMSADYTEDVIIPQIAEAVRRGADIGVA